MRKQRSAAIGIECEQHVPEITRIARQLLGPSAMAVVDRVRNNEGVETGRLAAEHDALDVDFKAGLERAVEELEAKSMERGEECHVWLPRQRIAQSKRPVSRELGQHPIGDRRQALVFFRRLLVRRTSDLALRAFGRNRINGGARTSLRLGFGNGWLVLRSHITALRAQYA